MTDTRTALTNALIGNDSVRNMLLDGRSVGQAQEFVGALADALNAVVAPEASPTPEFSGTVGFAPDGRWTVDDAFGKPINYQAPTLTLPGGVDAEGYLFADHARSLANGIRGLGLDVPAPLSEALAVWDTVQQTTTRVPIPQIGTMTADEAAEAVRDYVDRASRLSAAKDAQTTFLAQATARLTRACREAIDPLLAGFAGRFARAAEEYAETFPLVAECWTAGDAAMADEDGATVAAWHRCRKAAAELDRITDVVLGCLDRRPRSGAHTGMILALSGPVADDQAALYRELGRIRFRLDAGRVDRDHGWPFSVYSAQLASGGALALPRDRAEWYSRENEHLAKRGAAMTDIHFSHAAS